MTKREYDKGLLDNVPQLLDGHRKAVIVRFMRKLLAVNLNSVSEKEKLQRDIEQAPTLTEREWFLKRLTMDG